MGHAVNVIEVLARGVCIQEGRLLVCHTAGAQNTYLPGGHVEFMESAVVSLAREILEECGVPCRVGRFLGTVEHAFLQQGVPHAEINLIFAVEIPALSPSAPVRSQEGHLDFNWLEVATLAASNLEPKPVRDLTVRWATGNPDTWWASTL